MVVQHPIGDRVDFEALEHAEADLRVSFEDDSLRLGQRAGLAQDLFRDRELAEVVQARREPCQLDLLVGQPEAARRAGGQLGHALRVASGVDVTRIDGACEARRGPEAGCAIGAARQAFQLRELDHVRPVCAHAVLAVLLRPVQGAVSEADELVALRSVLR